MATGVERRRILLVEDEEHLAVGIKFNLEAEGYCVTTTGDGASALRFFEQENEFCLVILDLMLPGMSGYSVCEKLRAMNLTIPILMLSARTLPEDRARGFDLGADQYLTKPFDLDELLSRVRSLLKMYDRRASLPPFESEESHVFAFGNVHVDFATYETTVGDEPVKLTQLEMKLLQYFVRNEGRVIPRQELLQNVWEVPGSITTRAVDQFIRRLRVTFEPNPSEPTFFLTVRDVGYRFVADGDKPAG